MKSKFEMRCDKGVLETSFKIKCFVVIVSVLVIMSGLCLGKLYAQPVRPSIMAAMEIVFLEGEGHVEVNIEMNTTETPTRAIVDAEVRLEDGAENTILVLKGKDDPTVWIDMRWKMSDTDFANTFPNGSYKYVIDYGPSDVHEFPFEITDDFPAAPAFIEPADGDSVPRRFTVVWSEVFDDETLYPHYWLEFETGETFRGGDELHLEQLFGRNENSYAIPAGLLPGKTGVEVILTARKLVFVQPGPPDYLYVLKSTHIDMDVTTR